MHTASAGRQVNPIFTSRGTRALSSARWTRMRIWMAQICRPSRRFCIMSISSWIQFRGETQRHCSSVTLTEVVYMEIWICRSVWLNGFCISGPENPEDRLAIESVSIKTIPARVTVSVKGLTGIHCIRTKSRLEIYGRTSDEDKTKAIWFRGPFANTLVVTDVECDLMGILVPAYSTFTTAAKWSNKRRLWPRNDLDYNSWIILHNLFDTYYKFYGILPPFQTLICIWDKFLNQQSAVQASTNLEMFKVNTFGNINYLCDLSGVLQAFLLSLRCDLCQTRETNGCFAIS